MQMVLSKCTHHHSILFFKQFLLFPSLNYTNCLRKVDYKYISIVSSQYGGGLRINNHNPNHNHNHNHNHSNDLIIKKLLSTEQVYNIHRTFGTSNINFEKDNTKNKMENNKEIESKKESNTEKIKLDSSSSESSSQTTTTTVVVSNKSKLKQAVKDYGATVIIFHVSMSLVSLGMCYLLVSSGLDLPGMMEKIGIGESILQSKVTQGASTFVIAYAVHKIFAPVRITITLTATPLIVRRLRTMGILKKPLP